MTEENVREGYARLTKLLIERKMTITTMESCTAGQIASLITDTEGSSVVLKGAFVTYCNEAKVMQGVPAEVIERHTVYSKETALAMARACGKAYGADVSIGVTGTMGNADPSNPESSVPGEVYFAVIASGREGTWRAEIAPRPTRLAYKLAAAGIILEKIKEMLGSDA